MVLSVYSMKGMRMSRDIVRIFDVEDITVISSGDSFSKALEDTYLPKFSSFMGNLFNSDFLVDMQSAIADIRAIPTDEFFIKKQMKETADVELVRDQCAFEVRMLRVFASKAFADSPAVYDTFNFPGVHKVRKSSNKMKAYFSNLLSIVNENSDALLAVNFPETKYAELTALLGQFETEHDEQLSIKRQRALLTVHRVKALNHLWELMKEVSSVREFALPGDLVGQGIFALPQRSDTNTSDIA